jgi:cold shock protein
VAALASNIFETKMKSGTVRNWFIDRGYGFIAPDDGGADVFVHISETGGRELSVGKKLQFEIATSAKSGKLHAVNVTVR